jgi:hypothetical protein
MQNTPIAMVSGFYAPGTGLTKACMGSDGGKDECPQPWAIEEQVDIEVFVADIEPVLPPDEGESLAEFEQEFLRVADEFSLELAFLERLGQSEKFEYVEIFERVLDEVRPLRGERGDEI